MGQMKEEQLQRENAILDAMCLELPSSDFMEEEEAGDVTARGRDEDATTPALLSVIHDDTMESLPDPAVTYAEYNRAPLTPPSILLDDLADVLGNWGDLDFTSTSASSSEWSSCRDDVDETEQEDVDQQQRQRTRIEPVEPDRNRRPEGTPQGGVPSCPCGGACGGGCGCGGPPRLSRAPLAGAPLALSGSDALPGKKRKVLKKRKKRTPPGCPKPRPSAGTSALERRVAERVRRRTSRARQAAAIVAAVTGGGSKSTDTLVREALQRLQREDDEDRAWSPHSPSGSPPPSSPASAPDRCRGYSPPRYMEAQAIPDFPLSFSPPPPYPEGTPPPPYPGTPPPPPYPGSPARSPPPCYYDYRGGRRGGIIPSPLTSPATSSSSASPEPRPRPPAITTLPTTYHGEGDNDYYYYIHDTAITNQIIAVSSDDDIFAYHSESINMATTGTTTGTTTSTTAMEGPSSPPSQSHPQPEGRSTVAIGGRVRRGKKRRRRRRRRSSGGPVRRSQRLLEKERATALAVDETDVRPSTSVDGAATKRRHWSTTSEDREQDDDGEVDGPRGAYDVASAKMAKLDLAWDLCAPHGVSSDEDVIAIGDPPASPDASYNVLQR